MATRTRRPVVRSVVSRKLSSQWSTTRRLFLAVGEGETTRMVRLNLTFPYDLEGADLPLVFLSDAVMELGVEYATPQPFLRWWEPWTWGNPDQRGGPAGASRAVAAGHASGLLVAHRWQDEYRIRYDYWNLVAPEGTSGPGYRTDGGTEALARFKETRITGLASRPIVLRSDFSQTYATWHHNVHENFLFGSGMEPGIDPELLADFKAANVKALIIGGQCPKPPLRGGTDRL